MTTIALDRFERNVSSGWGEAELGGQWVGSGAFADGTALSVANGAGMIFLEPGGGIMSLSSASGLDTRSGITYTIDGGPDLGDRFVGLLSRINGNNDYEVAAAHRGTGVELIAWKNRSAQTLITVPEVYGPWESGQKFHLRAEVSGTTPVTILGKVWRDGEPEPEWQLVFTETATGSHALAGGVGVEGYRNTGTPETATLTLDDYNVADLAPQPVHLRRSTVYVGDKEAKAIYLAGEQVWVRESDGPVFRGAYPMPQSTAIKEHTFPVTNVGPATNGTHAIFIAGSTHAALLPDTVTIEISTVDGAPVLPVGGILRADGLGAVVAGIVDVSGRETITMRITTSASSINWTGALWTGPGTPSLLGISSGEGTATYTVPAGTEFTAGISLSEADGRPAPTWSGVESKYSDSTVYPWYDFRGDYADGTSGTVGINPNGGPARHVFYHLATG